MGTTNTGDKDITYDDKWSFRDYTGRKVYEKLDGLIIYSSCFSQETPDTHVFPDNMTGVTFVMCNLMNVFIPDGNICVDCNQLRFCCQNDGNDWLINEKNEPTMPIDHKQYTKRGLPIPKPEDIPQEKVAERIDLMEEARKLV